VAEDESSVAMERLLAMERLTDFFEEAEKI
jgi:hypothetical protein